jgi:hypothetical protein
MPYNCYEVNQSLLRQRAMLVGAVALAAIPLIYVIVTKVTAWCIGTCLVAVAIVVMDVWDASIRANSMAFKAITHEPSLFVNSQAFHRMKHNPSLFVQVVKHYGSQFGKWERLEAIRNGCQETLMNPLPCLEVFRLVINKERFQRYYVTQFSGKDVIKIGLLFELMQHPDYLHYVVEKGFLTKKLCDDNRKQILSGLMDLKVDLDRVFDVFISYFNLDFDDFKTDLVAIKEKRYVNSKYSNMERVEELLNRLNKIRG